MSNDFDDELLGLVGSDDEGDELDQTIVEPSPSDEPQESVEKAEEIPASTRRGVAQKVKSRGGRRRKQESESDEGEASPSEPESLDAGGIAESEDGAATAAAPVRNDEDGPLFPLEGQFYDSADRKHILSLPEIEREEILADRAQQVTRRAQDQQLKKAFASSEAKNKNKRSAAAAELEDSSRRNTRPKNDKRTALDDYKRAREEKDAARKLPGSARGRPEERSASSASDRDADGESDVEWAELPTKSRPDGPPPDLRHFEGARMGRTGFARLCFYPDFLATIKGCYCRVSIPPDHQTGQPQYRMALIKGIVEGKPYTLEMNNLANKKFLTDQYLLVAHGENEKPHPMNGTSDSKFTEAEFERYKETFRKEGLRLPSIEALTHKKHAIHALINTSFTQETLKERFDKQEALQVKYNPYKAAEAKSIPIRKRRQEAMEKGDDEEVERCNQEIQEIFSDPKVQRAGQALQKLKPATAEQKQMETMTHSNRMKNIETCRRALIEEKKRFKAKQVAARLKMEAEEKAEAEKQAKKEAIAARIAAKKKAKEGAEANGEVVESGLKVPNMADLFGESPGTSRAATPFSRVGTPVNGLKKERTGPLGSLNKKKALDDDVIGALDLGIDVEI